MQAQPHITKARWLALAAALSLPVHLGLAQAVAPAASPASAADLSRYDKNHNGILDPDELAAKNADDQKAAAAGAASVATAPSGTGDVVEMSPFVIDASKDEGYRATSTLAGSRINTDLRDLAAPITVVTKEFLRDVAAVDINDVVTYMANAEGSRDYTSSSSSLGKPTDDIAANPNGVNRIRGLVAADITRDYFYTIGKTIGFDTYNLDQVTLSRGPNSILAGLGSPSGIINYSPQLAGLGGRTTTEASYRFGSFGDQRVTLNSNIVAKNDVLAFRVAGVYNDRGFKQQPAWYEDTRYYLAGAYKPWKKTTVRASYEFAKINSDNPNSLTPEDDVSQWVAYGRPTYDSASTAPVSTLLTRNGTDQPTVMFNQSGAIERSYNFNTGYSFYYQFPPNVPIFTPQRMYDNRYFNLGDVNLNPSVQHRQLRTFSASIDQEIVKGLNANVAYVHETVDQEFLNLFRTEYAVYSVDVNKNLPGGAPNPHFQQPYMQYRGLDNRQIDHESNDVVRGSLTYELDLTQKNMWFGRWRATGFAESRKTETEFWDYNAKIAGNLGPETIGYRYYLADSATSPAYVVPQHPGLVSAVPDIVLNSNGTITTGSLTSFYGLKSDNRNLEKLDTTAAILQAWLWKDRIVGLIGIRKDKDERAFQNAVGGNGGIVPPAAPGYQPSSFFEQKTKTYGVVVRPLKWLSLHYNKADNFTPNAGAVDLLGNPTPPPKGTSEEYGFSVSLMENKLNAKLNWFELTAANAAAGNANFPIAQWTMPYMELTFMPDLARQAGITYKPLMAPGLVTGDQRLANAYTSDQVSKGLELELTYNVKKNWRIMASVSKQEAKQTNIASSLTAFIENRLAYWQSIPALWTGPYVGQNVGWGVGRTGQQQWNADNNPYYLAYKSADGKPSTQLAKWRGSVVTNYDFPAGTALKGVNVGMGGRYIEKPVIGNPVITNSSGAVVALDTDHPYYGHTYVALDAWVGYHVGKVFRDQIDLSFQLNARDLEQSGGFRPIVANSDGGHPVYRIVQPRTFYLTTTARF